MKLSMNLATLLAAVSSVVALTVDTPTNVVECQPVRLTWRDGIPPYWLIAIPGGQPAAPAIKTWDQTTDTNIAWVVDLPAGTSMNLALRDSTGTQAFSSIFTVRAGTSSCSGGGGGGGAPAPGPPSDTPTESTAAAASPSSTEPPREGPPTENTARTSTGSTSNRASGSNSNRPTSSSSGSNSSPSTAGRNTNGATRSEIAVAGLAGVVAAMGLAVL